MEETGVYDYIKNAVKKGVKVRILYGIGKNYNNFNTRDKTSKDIAQELDEDFKEHGDIFKIKRGDTHSKVLICDNKFAIIGSFNFLSFDGK